MGKPPGIVIGRVGTGAPDGAGCTEARPFPRGPHRASAPSWGRGSEGSRTSVVSSARSHRGQPARLAVWGADSRGGGIRAGGSLSAGGQQLPLGMWGLRAAPPPGLPLAVPRRSWTLMVTRGTGGPRRTCCLLSLAPARPENQQGWECVQRPDVRPALTFHIPLSLHGVLPRCRAAPVC